MIGGQAVDLTLQGAGPWMDALASRNLKTTALMRLTLMSGAVACGADEAQARVLANFGDSLGMAYQICDDLLDELGASHELGKPVKQDSRHCRSTFVAELGIEGAHRLASSLIEESTLSLRQRFGDQPAIEMLSDAAAMILRGAGRLTMASALVFLVQPMTGF
jgi:geranylgeranyl pyrophosphate synthase